MRLWNPWRGCHRYSEGCRFCYIHAGDKKRGVDTNIIYQTPHFDLPIRKHAKNEYIIPPNQLVYTCFSSDFFIEEADIWRQECWEMIKIRHDLTFLFLTKRIERMESCLPSDWKEGYDNVIISCSVEDQRSADIRLSILKKAKIKHKYIAIQPMLEKITIEPYLDGIELVVLGGESAEEARPLDYAWILDIKAQCEHKKVAFQLRQLGTHFIKDGVTYTIPTRQLCLQARKAKLDYTP